MTESFFIENYTRILELLNHYTDLYKQAKSTSDEMKQVLIEIEETKKALGIK
jgi:hypothetical protein